MKSDGNMLNLLFAGRIRDEELWKSLIGETVVHRDHGAGELIDMEGNTVTVRFGCPEKTRKSRSGRTREYHRNAFTNNILQIPEIQAEKTKHLIDCCRKKLEQDKQALVDLIENTSRKVKSDRPDNQSTNYVPGGNGAVRRSLGWEMMNSSADHQQLSEKERAEKQILFEMYQQKYSIKYLYHLTHLSNLSSILENGLLSHNAAHDNQFITRDISDQGVQVRRNWYHNDVCLFFQPRNSMMYRIIKEKNIPVILAIDPAVLLEASVKITDGNAASDRTRVFMKLNGLDELQWDIIKGECWTGENESEKKRIMSAEVLVPNKISPDQIRCIFCHDYRQLLHCQKLCPETIPVSINPYYYFKG